MANEILPKNLDALIFDFDGVLTNNRVYLDQDGREIVACHRGDGLAFDVFRKIGLDTYILSTEKNPVVSARGKKLKIPVLQGIGNKVDALNKLSCDKNIELSRILYIGNDLNDLSAMRLCGFSACPKDSHSQIVETAKVVLRSNGGEGVAREIAEKILKIDIHKELYT
jgi:3-deoxy-D-manno-octulosonate 8-phosphate phosphatase (KDO 8-P phosphatase)